MSDPTLIDEQIAALRESATKEEHSRSKRAGSLYQLAKLLEWRWALTQSEDNLNEAIGTFKDAINSISKSHRYQPSIRNDYALALLNRYSLGSQIGDLKLAEEQQRMVISLVEEGSAQHTETAKHLSLTVFCRWKATKERKDIDEAVLLCRKALDLSQSGEDQLGLLAHVLATRCHQALWHYDNSTSDFGQLSEDLHAEFDIRQKLKDLFPNNEHALNASWLNKIGTAFYNAAGRSNKDIQLLDSALNIFRQGRALFTATGHAESRLLFNTFTCLKMRYDLSENPADMDEALELAYGLLDNPEDADVRVFLITSLADLMGIQFAASRQGWKLNEAITRIYTFLETTKDDPKVTDDLRAQLLLRIGTFQRLRYLKLGKANQSDIQDSVTNLEKAHVLDPTNLEVSRSLVDTWLVNHHGSADRSCRGLEVCPTIQKAIDLQKTVVEQLNDGNSKSGAYSTLADAYNEMYLCTRNPRYLDAALTHQNSAIDHAISDRLKSGSIAALASLYHTRYVNANVNGKGDIADIEKGIEVFQRSGSVRANMNVLGGLLVQRFRHTQQPEDLDKAMDAYRKESTHTGRDPPQRFILAQEWAMIAGKYTHNTALEACTVAINVLPRVASLGLDIVTRQRILRAIDIDGIARQAARLSIKDGQYEKAIEFLEQGRSVFWSQALRLRTPTGATALEGDATEARAAIEQLNETSRAIELLSATAGTHLDGESPLMHGSTAAGSDSEFIRRDGSEMVKLGKLEEEWEERVGQVRQIRGFENYLRPKPFTELKASARNGIVVVLNFDAAGADALVLEPGREGVLYVPLPDFTPLLQKEVFRNQGFMRGTSEEGLSQSRGEPDPVEMESVRSSDGHDSDRALVSKKFGPHSHLGRTLAILWKTVCRPIIRELKLEKSERPPRLWWCPTGPFTSLPIHAAGIYDKAFKSECMMDYVVSSYVPTLSTLLDAREIRSQKLRALKVLVAIQVDPKRPGWSSLPETKRELEAIQKIVPPELFKAYGTFDKPSTVSNILSEIPGADIVHFACHGDQNIQNPLESALILEDDLLKVSDLMKLSLKKGPLVFLSACKTATAHKELPDEALTLAATMLFCGFKGAVGTMWSIRDKIGPVIAEGFYRNLLSTLESNSDRGVGTTDAALALHLAVIEMRKNKVDMIDWVPFIHVGC